tara:strand:- start:1424 stop:2188 length:765 start_codon:yes stop_codon:yes gene_type:complete
MKEPVMKKLKVAAIIEARMTSTRLPGKVLFPIYKDYNSIHLIVNCLKHVPRIDQIILATTTNEIDDQLQDLASKMNISCYRGSESNVMKRVKEAAHSNNADVIVEITADCPLLDVEIVEQTLEIFLNNNFDYVSNNNIPSYPDGLDVRVFNTSSLEKSYRMANSPSHFEHVTLHFRENPEIFSICNIIAPKSMRLPEVGITLDQIEDLNLIKIIVKAVIDRKSLLLDAGKVISFLSNNPELLDINRQVQRKGDK